MHLRHGRRFHWRPRPASEALLVVAWKLERAWPARALASSGRGVAAAERSGGESAIWSGFEALQ